MFTKCFLCGCLECNADTFSRHLKYDHVNDPRLDWQYKYVGCLLKTCTKQFQTPRQMLLHFEAEHNRIQFQCWFCEQVDCICPIPQTERDCSSHILDELLPLPDPQGINNVGWYNEPQQSDFKPPQQQSQTHDLQNSSTNQDTAQQTQHCQQYTPTLTQRNEPTAKNESNIQPGISKELEKPVTCSREKKNQKGNLLQPAEYKKNQLTRSRKRKCLLCKFRGTRERVLEHFQQMHQGQAGCYTVKYKKGVWLQSVWHHLAFLSL